MLVSAQDLIDRLKVSRQTLWRWRHQGLVPSGRLDRSGRLCFTDDEVAEIEHFAASYKSPRSKRSGADPRAHRLAENFPSGGSTLEGGVYLDANATTGLLPEVIHQIERVLRARPGNAASDHSGGEYYRVLLAEARSAVEGLIGAPPDSVIFTSGGTEANNLAVSGQLHDGCSRVLVSAADHSSLLNANLLTDRLGASFEVIPVLPSGVIDIEALERAVREGPAITCVHWVNAETGVIQPVEIIAEIVHGHGGILHVDAAQACGKMTLSVGDLRVDSLSMVGHKIHAPAGVGALYLRPGVHFHPIGAGGDQERGLRGGTENILGIVGFGAAAALRRNKLQFLVQRLADMRDQFEQEVLDRIPDVVVNGGLADVERVCNTSNLRFAGLDGQALVARLDQRGIQVSQSSACTSRRPEPSHVLQAMGLSEEEAYSSLRFSFSELNTPEEIRFVVDNLHELCQELRGFHQNLAAKYAD